MAVRTFTQSYQAGSSKIAFTRSTHGRNNRNNRMCTGSVYRAHQSDQLGWEKGCRIDSLSARWVVFAGPRLPACESPRVSWESPCWAWQCTPWGRESLPSDTSDHWSKPTDLVSVSMWARRTNWVKIPSIARMICRGAIAARWESCPLPPLALYLYF